MTPIKDESLLLQTCTRLDGTSDRIQLGRRNGRLIPLLCPGWTASDFPFETTTQDIRQELVEEVCTNLTPIERRTWLQILDGRSIPDIARDEGVSHAAIYARIRGKGGNGGMAAKNPYVGTWWELRRQRTRT